MAAEAAAAFILEGALSGTCKRPAACMGPDNQSSGPKLRLSWQSCTPPTEAGLGSPTTCSAEKSAKCKQTVEGDNGKPSTESPTAGTLSPCEASSQGLKKYPESLTLRLVDEANKLQPVEQLLRHWFVDDTGSPREASVKALPSTSQDPAVCPVCDMPPHKCESPTLELGGLDESDSLDDKAKQNPPSKSQSDDDNPREQHVLFDSIFSICHEDPCSKSFHLLSGSPMPLLSDNVGPKGDVDWAQGICHILANGIIDAVDQIGPHILTGDLDGALLHRLLEDHQASVAKICRERYANQSPPPTFARTSKTLVAPSDSQDLDVKNRYTMKLDLRNDTRQFILRLQVANLRGHTKQLGQFVFNFETSSSVGEDKHQHSAYVRSHQSPFQAMTLLHGVTQVIEWYGGQNALLSEGCIKALMNEVKNYWHHLRKTTQEVRPKPDEET